MSSDGPKEGYAFVIDTDSYAGNFEREMCAYLTGKIGDCGVGEEYVDENMQIDFNNIQYVNDDSGCYRPTSIWMNSDETFYDSVAIFFETKPTQEQIDFLKERVLSFNSPWNKLNKHYSWHIDLNLKILGFRLIKFNRKETSINI